MRRALEAIPELERPKGEADFGRGHRLLYFVNDLGFFVSHRLVLARAALAHGFEVHLIGPDEAPKSQIMASGVKFHPVVWGKWFRYPWDELRTLVQLRKLVRQIRPDLMHNITIRPAIFGSLVAWSCGVPGLINALPGLGYIFLADSRTAALRRRLVSWIYAKVFKLSKALVITQNPEDRNFFARDLGLGMERVPLIRGSGVNLAQYVPRTHSRADSKVRVLFAARLLVSKGIREYLLAAQEILARRQDAEFWVAGDVVEGNPGSICREELGCYSGIAGIKFLGHQSDMSALLREVEIVCLPSHGEGLPKSLLEAAACALPIITCDVPGCREVVEHGKNGMLVPARDVPALCSALTALIEDAGTRARFGAQGRCMVEHSFSEQSVIAQTMQLYCQVLKRSA